MRAPVETLRFSPPYVRRAKTLVTHARSLRWLARRDRVGADGLRILFYHRVSDERDPLTVSVDRFRAQMEVLADQGFRVLDVVTARRLLAGEHDDSHPHRRLIGLSFDDGYRDVAENALPVLEEFEFSATVFVVTGAVDGRVRFNWYDRQPELLRWGDIECLDATSQLSFEAHSETHPNLLTVSDDGARAELEGSKATLESHLGRPVRAFCYPGGLFAERERRLAADAGFEVAVSCDPGTNHGGSDPFALRRTQVEPGDRLLDFRAKVAGGHDTELPLRAPYRRLRYGTVTSADRDHPRAMTRGLIGRLHH